MAKDGDAPTAAEKGKGKAVDEPKDEKPVLNGKKEDGKKEGRPLKPQIPPSQFADQETAAEEELNEEDQQLKNELDMMVERLTASSESTL